MTINRTLFLSILILSLTPAISQAAQNCTGTMERTHPLAQFQDNGDGTITDQRTGLMWHKCAIGQTGTSCAGEATLMTWANAMSAADNSNGVAFAGYTNWRLPNIKELASLVERSCIRPALDLNAFPNTAENAAFWSSTTLTGNPAAIIRLNFIYGEPAQFSKTSELQLRLVRDISTD